MQPSTRHRSWLRPWYTPLSQHLTVRRHDIESITPARPHAHVTHCEQLPSLVWWLLQRYRTTSRTRTRESRCRLRCRRSLHQHTATLQRPRTDTATIQARTRVLCPDAHLGHSKLPPITIGDPCQLEPSYTCHSPTSLRSVSDLKDRWCSPATSALRCCCAYIFLDLAPTVAPPTLRYPDLLKSCSHVGEAELERILIALVSISQSTLLF